jgi:hypothetical protein
LLSFGQLLLALFQQLLVPRQRLLALGENALRGPVVLSPIRLGPARAAEKPPAFELSLEPGLQGLKLALALGGVLSRLSQLRLGPGDLCSGLGENALALGAQTPL